MAGVQYKIRNWERFQHYKDRNPPWIKLHMELLASADWVMLDDASKLLMVVCMMLASRNDGVLTADASYVKRVAYLRSTPNFKPLIACGFLIPLAGASTLLADARPEKEAETETEAETDTLSAVPADFARFWTDYPREKNMSKKRALMAWRRLSPEKRVQAQAAIPGYRSYIEKNKSWYHTVHAERFLSQERFDGFAAERQPTADEIAAARDKADRLMRRGKYAPEMGI